MKAQNESSTLQSSWFRPWVVVVVVVVVVAVVVVVVDDVVVSDAC